MSGHLFSVATAHGGAQDAYAELLSCEARAEGGAVRAHAVLAAWAGVSVDAAGVRLDQYLHATITVDAVYALRAEYAGGRLVVRMRPPAASRVAVTPVGSVGVSPTNWLTLLAGELAPIRGTTPEWIAKERMRDVAERTLHEALDRELLVCLDVAHDAVAFDCTGAKGAAPDVADQTRLWIAPHGTAFLGPFAAGSARLITVRGEAAHLVFRPLCLDDLAIVVAHDRRGEDVPLDDWTPLERGVPGPMTRGCAWGLAVRSGLATGEASFEVRPAASIGGTAPATRRWVAMRVTGSALEYGSEPAELWLESATEAVRLDAAGTMAWVAELAEGESVHLRVRGRGRSTLLGEALVPDAAHGTIEIRTSTAIAHATIEAHASAAPRQRAR